MGQFDFNAAVVLLHVVRCGSFRGAAKQLGLPKTSVSRKVAELEEQLGAQLLLRTTRTLALTDAGTAFVEEAEAALVHFEAAQEAVSELQRQPRGRLRITATVPTGELFLGALLAEFLAAYPKVEVTLHLTDRQVDLVSERFDVALRAGPLVDSSLVALPVGQATFTVVASPAYLAVHGEPKTPSDLSGHSCLLFARSGTSARGVWPFGKADRTRDIPVSGRLVADDFVALREAAIGGLGIARTPNILVRDAIRRGALVPLLTDYTPPATSIYLVHVGGRNMPARTRAFLDFIRPRLLSLMSDP